jgi:hypothetical protein
MFDTTDELEYNHGRTIHKTSAPQPPSITSSPDPLTGPLAFRWVRGQRKRQGKQAASRRALKCAKTLCILQLRILQRNMGWLKQRLSWGELVLKDRD